MPRLHSLKGRLLLAITVLVIGSGLVISSLVAYRYNRSFIRPPPPMPKTSPIRSLSKPPTKS
jgi:hypothetical protein